MDEIEIFIEKVLGYKTWSNRKKIDSFLEYDCNMYTNLGIDSTKKEVINTKRKSKKLYKAIQKIDAEQGKKLLYYMDQNMAIQTREQYIVRVFNKMHGKLDSAFEDAFDGDFDNCKNTINSLIYELKDFKKSMEA